MQTAIDHSSLTETAGESRYCASISWNVGIRKTYE